MTIINSSAESHVVNTSTHKIVLLNGTELACIPRTLQPQIQEESEMRLDATGKFLCVGGKPCPPQSSNKEESAQKLPLEGSDRDLFLKHAHFFFHNADRILKDSRMFLTPIPTSSHLAYSGTSGFQSPTLGIYIEWWLHCEIDNTHDDKGRDALTYHIAGSPLTGSNSCSCVYPDGTTAPVLYDHFGTIWKSFVQINQRYAESKQLYEAYTLQQVLQILLSTEQSEESVLSTKLLIQEGQNARLKKQLGELQEKHDELSAKYQDACIRLHQHELDEFANEYRRREKETAAQIAELDKQGKEIRAKRKLKEINDIEYQRLLRPLEKKRRELRGALSSFEAAQTGLLTKSGEITSHMISCYLEEHENKGGNNARCN